MIVSNPPTPSRVREYRNRLGISQAELARRAGVSRAAVSAMESNRLSPNVHAALNIAAALGASVESLFGREPSASPAWAWPAPERARYWQARVAGRTWLYPADREPVGMLPHDGIAGSEIGAPSGADVPPTLVVAGCDPAVGLLAAEYARQSGYRLLPLARSSSAALDLLGGGLVHTAGVHLGNNSKAIQAKLGCGYRMLRIAQWEEGVVFGPGLEPSAATARHCRKWVGRDSGSGARQCQDAILEGRSPPRRLARDHRGVAEAVRAGWARAGVCTRLPAVEAGLSFLPIRRENYDLAIPITLADDPLVRTLLEVICSVPFRRLLGDLPGYNTRDTGEACDL